MQYFIVRFLFSVCGFYSKIHKAQPHINNWLNLVCFLSTDEASLAKSLISVHFFLSACRAAVTSNLLFQQHLEIAGPLSSPLIILPGPETHLSCRLAVNKVKN